MHLAISTGFTYFIFYNIHCAQFQLMVKEEWITKAMTHLLEQEKMVVEGSGACPLAAIIGNLVPELKTKQ